jgi:hypothetical protein
VARQLQARGYPVAASPAPGICVGGVPTSAHMAPAWVQVLARKADTLVSCSGPDS